MLINKCEPKNKTDLIGCERQYVQLYSWFLACRSTPAVALISGPSGCGKSSMIKVLVNDFGISQNTLFADCLSRNPCKVIKEVGDALNTRDVEAFFTGRLRKSKPALIVLEDVDTVVSLNSTTGTSVIKPILALCKSANIPVLCTCHSKSIDRPEIVKLLSIKKCSHIKLFRPNSEAVANRIEKILASSSGNMGVAPPTPHCEIVKYCLNNRCDIRQCLMGLELFGKIVLGHIYDADTTISECLSTLFVSHSTSPHSIDDVLTKLHKYEKEIPQLVYENYCTTTKETDMSRTCQAIEEISVADYMSKCVSDSGAPGTDNTGSQMILFQSCILPCKRIDATLSKPPSYRLFSEKFLGKKGALCALGAQGVPFTDVAPKSLPLLP